MPGYLSSPTTLSTTTAITPSGNLSAITIQTAITELEAEKVFKNGDTITAATSITVPLIIKGAASQSVNLQEWKNSANTNVMYVDNSGNLVASGDVTTNSDVMLKENIVNIENAIDMVKSLNGVTFTRKSDPNHKRSIGLIAQDVEELIPEAVAENGGIKSVAYGNLVAVLVEAIKEQQKEIDELKEKINGL